MTVATSTASGGGVGACFLAQERETSPARRTTDSFVVKRLTFRSCRSRDASVSVHEVFRPKLSLDRSPAARPLWAHPLPGVGFGTGRRPPCASKTGHYST